MIAAKNTSPDRLRPATAGTPWQNRLTGPGAAALVLVVFYTVLLASLREKSATLDEPGHATAGYTYWKFGDYRLDPENGNLPQRVIALPLVVSGFRFPGRDSPAWKRSELFALSTQWIYDLGNDTEAILNRGRAANALLAVACGAVIWMWSRRLFGATGGMLSLVLYVTNPSILANGGLMTSEMASTFFLLFSLFCFCEMLRKLSPARVALSAMAMGAMFVAKMSAVLLIPVVLLLGILRVFDARPLALAGPRTLVTRGQRALALSLAAAVHIASAALIIWASYGFRFSAFADGQEQIRFPWAAILDEKVELKSINQINQASQTTTVANPNSAPARLAAFALRHHLLPEAYIYGFAFVWRSAGGRFAFLNGEVRLDRGWRTFFPYTILVKTPIALFAIGALALAAWWPGWRRRIGESGFWLGGDELPLLLFIAVYLAAAISSNINIGHRHILPIYPPLFVLCGAGAKWIDEFRRARAGPPDARITIWPGAILGSLVLVLAVETVCWFPNYLSYFNGIVRPSQAYRHLVDSSLDWGQDLPALRRYLDERRPAPPHYLAQFGADTRPDHYGITATRISNGIAPPLLILQGVSLAHDRARIEEYLHDHPDFDNRAVADLPDGATGSSVILRKAAGLRLGGGTYFISATALQPLNARTFGPWTGNYEAAYQRLKEVMEPLLSDDLQTRFGAFKIHSPADWLPLYEEFADYRFARLTAYLRNREPDDNINYSILVYALSDAEVTRALEGPPPFATLN